MDFFKKLVDTDILALTDINMHISMKKEIVSVVVSFKKKDKDASEIPPLVISSANVDDIDKEYINAITRIHEPLKTLFMNLDEVEKAIKDAGAKAKDKKTLPPAGTPAPKAEKKEPEKKEEKKVNPVDKLDKTTKEQYDKAIEYKEIANKTADHDFFRKARLKLNEILTKKPELTWIKEEVDELNDIINNKKMDAKAVLGLPDSPKTQKKEESTSVLFDKEEAPEAPKTAEKAKTHAEVMSEIEESEEEEEIPDDIPPFETDEEDEPEEEEEEDEPASDDDDEEEELF